MSYLGRFLAIGADAITLDDVELVGVRRAVIVDEIIGMHEDPDRVDDERVAALVVADGFAVPGRRRIHRMRHVQIDVPYLIIATIHEQHEFWLQIAPTAQITPTR